MLARTSRSLPLSRACRCTSTSISPPCPHATSTTTRHLLTTTHYHDRLPLSPLELTRLRLPSEEALEYTAPLWEHQFQYYYESAKEQQEEGSSSGKSKDHEERWFATATTGVKRRDWRGWIRESRVVEGAGIVPGAPPPPPPPAPAAPIAASPSPSLRKDKQPASASPPSAQVEELERYISLTSLPSNNDASLSTTLPQDHLTRLQRTARQLGMKVVEGQLQAQLDAQPESATPTTAALSTEEQLSTLLNRTDARSTLAAFLSPSPSPSDDLLSTTFISSTPTLTPLDRLHSLWNAFSTSEQTDLHQLGDFQLSLSLLFHLSSPSNGESRTAHLELALSILRTLISCNALAEDQVASPPTYAAAEGMGKELVLRVVLMRTVVSAALGDGNAELAEKAVRELVGIRREVEGELRGEVLEATERDETESELILDVVEEMVDRHRIVRAETYRSHLHSSLADPSPSPSPSPTTSTSPASTSPHSTSLASSPTSTPSSPTPLLSIHSLLTCLPPPPSPSHHSTRLSPLLTSLSRESVALRRWDVLSSLFLSPSTSTTGQRTLLQTPRFARGLAKWFAGELVLGGAEGERKGWGRGMVRRREWEVLIALVAREARGGGLEEWTTGDKAEWVEVLVNSRLGGRISWTSAVELYRIWSPPSSGPLPLKPSTLLSLARHSLSLPPSFPATSSTSFATQLATDYITRLTSPSSPYSTPTLGHYDLTTLASLYTILGDQESVGQVYRKMLELKVLPDGRDVEIVLETVWSLAEEGEGEREGDDRKLSATVGFLTWAHEVGVKVGKGTVERLLRKVYLEARDAGGGGGGGGGGGVKARERAKKRGKGLLRLARRVGLEKGERLGLRSFVGLLERELNGTPAPGNRTPPPPPPAEMLNLLSPHTRRFHPHALYLHLHLFPSWRHSLALHQHALQAHQFQDDRSISLVLRSLLAAYELDGKLTRQGRSGVRGDGSRVVGRPMRKEREEIRRGLREVIEGIVNPPSADSDSGIDPPLSPVMEQGTAELVVRAAFKLGDVEALERLVRRVYGAEGGGVVMSGELREVVERWIGGQRSKRV